MAGPDPDDTRAGVEPDVPRARGGARLPHERVN